MIVTNPFSSSTYAVQQVARRWWMLAVVGVISIVAGTAILYTDWSVADLAVFIGALFVFRGFFSMFSSPVDGSGAGWSILTGLLEVGVGVTIWVWPAPTLLVVAFMIGWYVLFSGVFTIAGAISGRDTLPYWGFVLAFGLAEVAISFWLLTQPGLTLVAAVAAIGLWCVLYGVFQIILAFDVKRLGRQADAVSGAPGTVAPNHLTRAAS